MSWRLIAKPSCLWLVVLVVLVALCDVASSRSKLRSVSKRRAEPGCCPPSYKANYRLREEDSGYPDAYFMWNAAERISSWQSMRTSSMTIMNKGRDEAWVDITGQCTFSRYPNVMEADASNYICLPSNAVYIGKKEFNLIDGQTVTADYYSVRVGSVTIVKYYEVNEDNCIAIAEDFINGNEGPTVKFAVTNIQLEDSTKPAFTIPEEKC